MLLLGDAELVCSSLLQPATGEQSAGYYSKMPRSRQCQKLRLTSIKIGEMSVFKLPILIVLIKSMSRQIETPCLNFFKKNFLNMSLSCFIRITKLSRSHLEFWEVLKKVLMLVLENKNEKIKMFFLYYCFDRIFRH